MQLFPEQERVAFQDSHRSVDAGSVRHCPLATPSDKESSNRQHDPKVSHVGAGSDAVEFWMESQETDQASSSQITPPGKENQPVPSAEAAQTAKRPDGYTTVSKYFQSSSYPWSSTPNLTPADSSQAYPASFRIPQPKMEKGRNKPAIPVPVVNVGSALRPTYLPATVCTVRHGQPARSLLTPDQTRRMLDFAKENGPKETMRVISQDSLRIFRNEGLVCHSITVPVSTPGSTDIVTGEIWP